ncbi:hypothetical protein FB45DRAFT_947057 [Roridomyces roridus]|uniref:Uncharacterized protein n=1 Tax=Roridomyces roridus TaxID=1738132 RepID=A0AAD7B2S5_9AGAR|nr:hypothetical protein FB45DRAFT_947057 [Roridomyces roridus]
MVQTRKCTYDEPPVMTSRRRTLQQGITDAHAQPTGTLDTDTYWSGSDSEGSAPSASASHDDSADRLSDDTTAASNSSAAAPSIVSAGGRNDTHCLPRQLDPSHLVRTTRLTSVNELTFRLFRRGQFYVPCAGHILSRGQFHAPCTGLLFWGDSGRRQTCRCGRHQLFSRGQFHAPCAGLLSWGDSGRRQTCCCGRHLPFVRG